MDIDRDDPHGNYTDGNRAFLQAFMARGQLSLNDSKQILAAIFSIQENREVSHEEVTEEDFKSYMSAAADALSPLDYEIRSTKDQVTKARIYAIVNSISDPLTQMATTRTTEEMLYVKRLLDAMFETYNTPRREVMAITGIQALEKKVLKGSTRASEAEAVVSNTDKGLTGGEAEKLLGRLVTEKWLERSAQGFYRLSSRALMELRSWLLDAYNEETDDPDEWQRIKFCEACKDIITVGQRCVRVDCNVRLHDICEAAYWNSRPNKQCPKCNTAWDGEHFVGQRAITSTEEYLRGKRRSGISANNKASSSRGRRTQQVVEEEEEAEEEQEDVEMDDEEEEEAEEDDEE
ncbi:hypothetical protein HYFRA_00005668 [Hymenoscyphus fraxineus]|uniref:Non-structural maintenance of chromosomes element 1 homolog n=1 Tax=Hymenoscyphus fraxineus TaxID=746836 RepID=A0A9N9KQY3_9HELO|nr:hypothetical protein HYFRA_00005668 [Hymenoscyphus fraxineus]